MVLKTIEGTSWEALKPCLKGMNALALRSHRRITDALKPYRTFQKEMKVENGFTGLFFVRIASRGLFFEGRFYGPGDFKQLENMPTRTEIYAKLLGSLQSPAIGLVGTLQAPARDVVMLLKAYVKKLEEESGGS